MAPVVLSELVSDPALSTKAEDFFLQIPLLTITEGYWHRAGKLRSRLFQLGYRPKLADTLIAQVCLDHRVPLLTRDRDFRSFAKHAQLNFSDWLPFRERSPRPLGVGTSVESL